MFSYDAELRILLEQKEEAQRLQIQLADEYRQWKLLVKRTNELEAESRSEQTDVERLEGRSLKALVYGVLGRREVTLDHERAEARTALVKYEAAALDLARLEEDIRFKEDRLEELRGCRERYGELLNQKAKAIKATGSAAAAKILELESRDAQCRHQEKELREALAAGRSAMDLINEILDTLSCAENWAVLDVAGDNILFDLAKHNTLDRAQDLAEQLQVRLRSFRTELADVELQAEVQVRIDGFLRFADYFFDGLLVDFAVMGRIRESAARLDETRQAVEQTMERLAELLLEVQQDTEKTALALEELVKETQLSDVQ